ncbi:MAG: hypothetical protein HUU10_15710 [Bacteroidetes bacterium]|nr:hypothetical protein [Bacteroidota bacterium]
MNDLMTDWRLWLAARETYELAFMAAGVLLLAGAITAVLEIKMRKDEGNNE